MKYCGLLFVAIFMGIFEPGRCPARPFQGAAQGSLATAAGHQTDVIVPALQFSDPPTTAELFRARVFDEPLVPIGGEPTQPENADLAAALLGYAQRRSADDFSSLTSFLDQHPDSVWRAALLTGLGMEYYNTAHYSLALEAWKGAWAAGQNATTAQGKVLADRVGGELAYMYARLGRMDDLETFLQSVQGRPFIGTASQRIIRAREGLWAMKNRPEIAFRCGPLALYRIKLTVDPKNPAAELIRNAASTQRGCSLPQVTELSRKIGLTYQMAFRQKDAPLVVPSVVHWKVGHYAALTRQVGDNYLLEDPTFGNTVWATRTALDQETSGYFLIPPGPLPKGWRPVEPIEGETIWGKGYVGLGDPGALTPRDFKTGAPVCRGMVVPQMHLLTANLSLSDQPVGYTPPVGPAIAFTVRYNSLDGFQPANEYFSNFGPQWSSDWVSFITDNPTNSLADVAYYIGGGQRTFTRSDTNSQSFAYQVYDQTLLTRTASNPISYTMSWPDGSQMVFSHSDGSVGSSRRVFLTQVVDPQGNTVTLSYSGGLLVAITDAIGQVTTITHGLPGTNFFSLNSCTGNTNYSLPADPYKITQVTDPFGRSATFTYTPGLIGWFTCTNSHNQTFTNLIYAWLLNKITDVNGLSSQLGYNTDTNAFGFSETNGQLFVTNYIDVTSLTTPYGTTFFSLGYGNNGGSRAAEIQYPDGSRERVEYHETSTYPESGSPFPTPQLMYAASGSLFERNTFYWSRNACASSYGDYSKARLFHWIAQDLNTTQDILLSTKEPLENRVWYDYGAQSGEVSGTNNQPAHIGRVLDDGSTQLYSYSYNAVGRVTSAIDPVGRTFSCIYATNGIDLLEVRMTRAAKNELLFKATYNSQHRPLTTTDAAGQTTSYSYNVRGQLLSVTNARNETLTFDYDSNGYRVAVHGPLPGTNDTSTMTYDAFGRPRTLSDVSGYSLTLDYDNLDRVTQITHPDGTFEQMTFDRLDPVVLRNRAGRLTLLNYDSHRQLAQVTDPLGRATRLDWCSCGALKSLTDPMGRTTSWQLDVQGRPVVKQFPNGSQINYSYENTTSRLRQVLDEKQQITHFSYNLDDTLRMIDYGNATVPTSAVSITYDPDYQRVTAVTDGAGTTSYSYIAVTGSPVLGAGRLATMTGPLPNEALTYGYDELGRMVHRAINGVDSAVTYDAAGRIVGASNILGSFNYSYDGAARRLLSAIFPNGQTTSRSYGSVFQDLALQRITHQAGATLLSEFLYGVDAPSHRITTWSQQSGTPPSLYTFSYDAANQLLSATVTNAGVLANTFAYSYDPAANRLGEQAGGSNYLATYNALNQLTTTTAPGGSRTNEWDGANRLTAVNTGNQRAEFAYGGASRMVGIRQLLNGSEVSHRMFAWHGGRIIEERDTNGVVTKRFFPQGVQLVTGTNAGLYYYTRDHLGSIRELTDAGGNVRARYAYDPFGRRTKLSGDLDADFGFAGMFWGSEVGLYLTHFRQYGPQLGRWLSRDPLGNAELKEGPNLYAYVRNNPISRIDRQGLGIDSPSRTLMAACARSPSECAQVAEVVTGTTVAVATHPELVEEGVAALEMGLPAAEAEIPTLVECAPSLQGRVQAIAERIPEALRQSQQYFQDVEAISPASELIPSGENAILFFEKIRYVVPNDFLIDMVTAYDEVALQLAEIMGVDILRARELLSQWLGGFSGKLF
jgi:RHS repeat-associated protein